jgi:hypothetical protein
MTNYDFRYMLAQAPTPSNDGSGVVYHDIWAVARPQGTTNGWTPVPGRHKTVAVLASDLTTVMAMPHATGPQRTAKTNAYKQLLAASLNYLPSPIEGWNQTALEALMDANDAAVAQAVLANDYITVTLAQQYPVYFNL